MICGTDNGTGGAGVIKTFGAFRGGERVVNEPQVPQGVNVLDRLYVVDDGLKITSLVGFAGEVLEDGVFRAQDFQ